MKTLFPWLTNNGWWVSLVTTAISALLVLVVEGPSSSFKPSGRLKVILRGMRCLVGYSWYYLLTLLTAILLLFGFGLAVYVLLFINSTWWQRLVQIPFIWLAFILFESLFEEKVFNQ